MAGREDESVWLNEQGAILVFARGSNGREEAKEFIEALSSSDQAKVCSIGRVLVQRGTISNDTKFKKRKGYDALFEIKVFQIRIFAVLTSHSGRKKRFVLTHGTLKKRDKMSKTELERAQRIFAEHEADE